MKPKIKTWLVSLTILGLMGGLVYVGMLYKDYKRLSEDLTVELQRANAKISAFQNRVREQKAQLSWLEQAKRNLEGQVAKLNKDLEAKDQEIAEAQAGCEVKFAEYEHVIGALQTDIKGLKQHIEGLNGVIAKVRDEYQKMRQRNLEISQAKSEVENALAMKDGEFHEAVSHNRRLATAMDELLIKYRDKGVGDAIAGLDPFTGIKKIESQGIMDKYARVIKDNKLETTVQEGQE